CRGDEGGGGSGVEWWCSRGGSEVMGVDPVVVEWRWRDAAVVVEMGVGLVVDDGAWQRVVVGIG
ncbi:hypothetical protein Tco_1178380, partial [Tanacetum coccineum]